MTINIDTLERFKSRLDKGIRLNRAESATVVNLAIEQHKEIERLKDVLNHVRIMATESYLNQDGKSIVAASDFRDIQDYILEALNQQED